VCVCNSSVLATISLKLYLDEMKGWPSCFRARAPAATFGHISFERNAIGETSRNFIAKLLLEIGKKLFGAS
jgi:hypothetical protein